MADWGMKISLDGYDAVGASGEELLFTSAEYTVPVVLTGTAAVILDASTSKTSSTTYLYLPSPNAKLIPMASTIINGRRFVTNIAAMTGPGVDPTDEHAFAAQIETGIDAAGFTITRFSGSTKSGVSETFLVRFFIIGIR